MAIALYRAFHRRLRCNIFDILVAFEEERDLDSSGELSVSITTYKGQNGEKFIVTEIVLEDLCGPFIDVEEYFFHSHGSTLPSRIPVKSPEIRAFIEKPDKSKENILILGSMQIETQYNTSILFQYQINDIPKYLMHDDKIVLIFEFDIYIYHVVPEINLQDICYANLSINLSKYNVFEYLEYAQVYYMQNLIEQCINLIVLNYDELILTEEYKKLKDHLIVKIEEQKFRVSIHNPELHEIIKDVDDEDEDETDGNDDEIALNDQD
ncbi:hypothetical protein PVAND_003400 [Polypedilum vanderplanki]|uniref:Uncharacterized protein n=1 Tax=Polypedilum vanderplanki TaxID=319348 RepID=A0A9J6BUY1_POLVA|nr:hypothetical protein PVAND_003400 [Polypedilum vanderplanki]